MSLSTVVRPSARPLSFAARFHLTPGVGAWAAWLAVVAAAFWLVAVHGYFMPCGDEWSWLPVVAGEQPVTFEWLWSQHAEHRMFLPRLLYVALGAVSGFNFKAGAYYNVSVLAALAAAMMLTARKIRGRTSLCDAFFPLVLLNWGHFVNIGWGFQLNFVTAVSLTGVVVIVIARCGSRLSWASAGLVAACMLGAGLCGFYGLLYLPAMAAWLAFAAIVTWRSAEPRAKPRALGLAALAALLLALVGVCFLGLERVPRPSGAQVGLLERVRTGVQFLSGALGLASKEIWPLSGVLILGAIAISVRQLGRVFRDQPQQRLPAAGFLCLLGTVLVMAAAVGWERAADGPEAGFACHYVLLFVPMLCVFYLQSLLFSPRAASARVERVLLVLMCVLAVVNSRKGLQFAIERNSPLRALEADARAGLSPDALAVRYCEGYVFHASDAVYAQRLETLRKCRLGPYRGLTAEPLPSPLRVRPIVPLDPERPPADNVPLCAGEEFTQRFSVAGPVEIRRIDLCLGQWRRNRSPDHVDWTLAEIAPADGDGYLAGGRIDLRAVADHGFVTLDFPAVAVEGTKQFAIRLTPLPAEESQPPLNIPVFAETAGSAASDARNLNGFLFYEIRGQPNATAPRPHGIRCCQQPSPFP
jgi:hypothetical protein